MANMIKIGRNIIVGTIATTGVMIASKGYLDSRVVECLPVIGIIAGAAAFGGETIENIKEVFTDVKRDKYSDEKNAGSILKTTASFFVDGTVSILFGIGMPVAVGITDAFLKGICASKTAAGSMFIETINNKQFMSILHAGSDILIVGGIATYGVGLISHFFGNKNE